MATFGHEGGYGFNEDQRAAKPDTPPHEMTELNQWKQYAEYCRSCAVRGDRNPLDFADFTQGD
jgi:hypothetical protein